MFGEGYSEVGVGGGGRELLGVTLQELVGELLLQNVS